MVKEDVVRNFEEMTERDIKELEEFIELHRTYYRSIPERVKRRLPKSVEKSLLRIFSEAIIAREQLIL